MSGKQKGYIWMFSKIFRKLHNFILIPFTFQNWIQVIGYVLFVSNKTGIVVLRGGQKLKIRLSNYLDIGSIIEVYQRKEYSPPFLYISDNATIIDIGASIGDFSVYCASSFDGSKILSYEPDENAFELLRKNIQLNHLENKITPYPFGISGTRTKIKIGTNRYNSISVEDVFKENNIEKCDLLKVDCEGMEYEILLSTSKEILQCINAMVMECHIYDKGENLSNLRKYLTEAGFYVTTTDVTAHNVCYLYAIKQ